MASIDKRQTTRGPRYDVRYRDPAGKPRKRTFETLAKARAHQRTVDTDIDQAGYMTGPPPPPVGPPVPKTLDTAAYDQAVSAARAQRESEAQSVMPTVLPEPCTSTGT